MFILFDIILALLLIYEFKVCFRTYMTIISELFPNTLKIINVGYGIQLLEMLKTVPM